MSYGLKIGVCLVGFFFALSAVADPFPPEWQSGAGAAVHYQPIAWPAEPADAKDCGTTCGDWQPYTRFQNDLADARNKDTSNGGTAPQSYVNVSSSCDDRSLPSIYYALYQGATEADDVLMFRWRVEAPAHNYATGPNAGRASAGNPWSSALWTVFFDIEGSGFRSLAAHLDGSVGSPGQEVDILAGIWGESASHSLDYANDPYVHLLGHNPTAFTGASGGILNFQNSLSPLDSWPNGSAETSWDYGTTRAKLVSKNSCNEYFVDYQIPVAMLDASALGGPKITRSTPIAMMFCTANSLNNPLQKDCAISKNWVADTGTVGPFGDYLSFNQTEPYSQPIIAEINATPPASCPGSYKLQARVQDTLALQNGSVVTSVQAVEFFYWFDRNGDGEATTADTGSTWIKADDATLVDGTLNTWTGTWDSAGVPKGQYLIAAQALDDNLLVDDGMTPSGIDNRTFSYLSGDSANHIYVGGAWAAGQQAVFPDHSPTLTPIVSENWYGNPDVTGSQVAVIGTAINICGLAPAVSQSVDKTEVGVGDTVEFTISISNPAGAADPLAVNQFVNTLPDGFSYVASSASGATTNEPAVSGQVLTWSLSPSIAVSPGSSLTLTFEAMAASDAGVYNNQASVVSDFGVQIPEPLAVMVDAPRVSLKLTPSAYSIAADGVTELTYTGTYTNESNVTVYGTSLTTDLLADTSYVGCTGGSTCAEAAGTVTWSLGDLAPGATGSASLTITVADTWASTSLSQALDLAATDAAANPVSATATTTVAVTGVNVVSPAAFSLRKSASEIQVAPGDSLTYTLNYNNYGGTAATDVVLTDTLPAGVTYSSCTGGCDQIASTVTWNLGTIAAGASGSVSVTVAVASPFTAPNPAVNTASINWSGGVAVGTSADVGITGQACNTYYFSDTTGDVGASGNQKLALLSPVPTAATTGSSVTVTAPSVSTATFSTPLSFFQDPATTSDVPFSGNITTNIYIDRSNGPALNLRASVYDYDSATGTQTLLGQNDPLSDGQYNGSSKGLLSVSVPTSGTLSKGHRLLWTFEAQSNHNSNTYSVQFQYGGTVANTVSGSGTTAALSGASFCVTPPANLLVSESASENQLTGGATDQVVFTVQYANTGAADADNATLINALPSGFTNCEYSMDNSNWASCSDSVTPAHTFSLGTLAGGASGAVYLRGNAPAGSVGGDTLTASASIVSDQTTEKTATAAIEVLSAGGGGTAELALLMSADKNGLVPGESVTYTLTVINIGGVSATNVEINNTLPVADYFSYTMCSNGCSHVGNDLSWAIGTLAAGASQAVSYTMTVGATNLTAGISAIDDDALASGDGLSDAASNTVTVYLSGNPQLSIAGSASPNAGLAPKATTAYSWSVTNNGSVSATAVQVIVPIPGELEYAGNASASVGSARFDGVNNEVILTAGDLVAGASAVLSFNARVLPVIASGTTVITATGTASASNAQASSANVLVSATAAASFNLVQNVSGGSAYPAALLTASATSTTEIEVDKPENFGLGQKVMIGAAVATVVATSATTITLDQAVTAPDSTAVVGGLRYLINYQHTGDATAINAVLNQVLPTGIEYYLATPAPASAPSVGSNGTLIWNLGDLSPGHTGGFEVWAFPSGDPGAFTITATLEADNADTETASVESLIGGLTLAKATSTPQVVAGSTVSYSITLSNSLGSAISPVRVDDQLPPGFSYRTGTASVGGIASEPDFAIDDTAFSNPFWDNLTVPAGAELLIEFDADVDADAGAGVYQNTLSATAPATVGLQAYDTLARGDDDVTVLASDQATVTGIVFHRTSATGTSYVPGEDSPLESVQVEIYQNGADCSDLYAPDCYIVYTDADGRFAQVVTSGTWAINVVTGSGELDGAWPQRVGSNDDTYSLAALEVVADQNGFGELTGTSIVTDVDIATDEDMPYTFAAAAFIAAFTDTNGGDALQTLRIDSLPEHGILTLAATPVVVNETLAVSDIANLVYTPGVDYNGADSFGWNATDGLAYDSSAALVNITVNPVADPSESTIVDINKTLDEDTALTFAASDFSTALNDSSGGSNLVRIRIDALPEHGALTLNNSAVLVNAEIDAADIANLVYTPVADYNGTDAFAWNAFDGAVYAAANASVNLTITPVADSNESTIVDINKTLDEDTSLTFAASDFSAALNDSSGGSNLVRIRIDSLPAHGVLTLNNSAVLVNAEIDAADIANLVYTPVADYNGTDAFAWNAFDGAVYAAANASVNLTITPVADSNESTIVDINKTLDEDTALTFAASDFSTALNDSSGGSNLVQIRIDSLPAHGALTLNNSAVLVNAGIDAADIANLMYTPVADYNGTDAFAWNAFDGAVYAAANASVNLTITPVADSNESTIVDINKTLDEDTSLTFAASDFSAALNDSSGGSNLVRIRIDSLPAHGVLTLNNSAVLVNAEIDAADIANLTYTPVADYNGTDAFAWNAFDGAVYAAANASVNLTITPVADSNESTIVDINKTLDEDTSLTFAASDFSAALNDSSGGSNLVRIRIDSLPAHGALTLNNSAVLVNAEIDAADIANLTYTPVADYNGTDAFAWNTFDGAVYAAANASVNLTITPVADSNESTIVDINKTLDEDTALTFAASDFSAALNDSSGGSNLVRIRIDALPEHGALTLNNSAVLVSAEIDAADIANLVYTPVADYNGTDTFAWNAFDGAVYAAANASVNLTITPVADPGEVVAANFAKAIAEDTVLAFSVEDFTSHFTDASGGAALVTLRVDALPDKGVLRLAGVNVTLNQAIPVNLLDSLTYTPEANYAGADQWQWNGSDGTAFASASAEVAITITEVTDPIAAFDFELQLLEDTPFTFTATHFDDHFDAGADALPLTYVAVATLPAAGVLSLYGFPVEAGDSLLRVDLDFLLYTPTAEYFGEDDFTWRAGNGEVWSEAATITFNIANVVDLGAVMEFAIELDEDTEYVFSASEFTAHYSNEIEQTELATVRVTQLPSHGNLYLFNVMVSPNTDIQVADLVELVYVPAEDYAGADRFDWNGSDGNAFAAAGASVQITVHPVADPGEAADIVRQLDEDSSLRSEPEWFTQAFAAGETETDLVSVRVDSLPNHGTLTLRGVPVTVGQVITLADWSNVIYQPEAEFSGDDGFAWSGFDGTLYSANGARVILQVLEINDGPVSADEEITLAQGETATIDVLSGAYDNDNDVLTVVSAYSDFGTVTIVNNQLVFLPDAKFSGVAQITYLISDGKGGLSESTVIVNVLGNGDEPALEVPEDKFESATALYTKIDLGVARAEDRFGNPLPVSLVDGVTFFEPGINRVFWQAVDVDGNRRVEMQEVKVRPLISVEKDQRMLEGRRGRIGVYLNGASPEYPLAIPYTVTGTASVSDHNLRSGTLVIRAGLEGYIEFDVFSDGSTDANETLIVTLDPTNNRGNRFEHKVTITEGNVAPVVTVFGEQNGDKRLTFSRDESEGQAVLKAMVFDDNPEDTHTWQWLTPGHETPDLDTDVSQFTLDPQSMIAGLYTFEVSVTDSGTPALMQNQRVYIEIVDRLAPIADGLADFDRDLIPDAVEGYGDDDGDGIPNYADSRDECNVLHEEIIDQDGYLIEGEPGVCLRRGFFTAQGESGGALITDGDVAVQRNALTPDPDADNVCGVFDYIGYGLPEAGQSYHIVMPQRKPIPANAVYRKFMNGQWGFFVEDESNSIASAPGEQGFCPPPGGAVWQPGLTPGHWCVQLTVADGGPNDDDGVANGTVVDPGGVAVLKSINQAPVSEDFGIQGDAGANVVLSPLEHTDDPDGDALTVINASATFGTVTINADNTLTLMPPAEYLGEILVTYTVSDGRGGISVANISVEVAVAAASTPVRLRTRGGAFGGVELTFLVGFLAFGICLRRGSRRARLSLGLGLIAMFSTFQAQADNEPTADGFEPHFFVSGRLGLARSLTTTGELERRFDRIGYNIDVTHIDRLDMGYALGIGYQFRDHWAVVGGGAHLGEFAIDLEGELDDEEAFYRAAETLHPESAKGLFAALQYQVPFGERWRASFRLGALSWKGEYSTHLLDMGGQEVGDDRQSGTDLYLGGGVALALDRRWSIDAGWERYFFDNHDVDFWSLGLSYRFGFRKQDSPVASKPQPQEPPQWLPIEEPVPEKLNEQSCQMFTGSLHGVNFESASAKLTAEAIETLVLVKSVLDEFPDITIAIAAHTDSIGSEASNLALAQARAESVRDFLIAHDILPERLHAEGFGEKRPIASNDTPQGRAENRRVEIRLVEDGKHNCDE